MRATADFWPTARSVKAGRTGTGKDSMRRLEYEARLNSFSMLSVERLDHSKIAIYLASRITPNVGISQLQHCKPFKRVLFNTLQESIKYLQHATRAYLLALYCGISMGITFTH